MAASASLSARKTSETRRESFVGMGRKKEGYDGECKADCGECEGYDGEGSVNEIVGNVKDTMGKGV